MKNTKKYIKRKNKYTRKNKRKNAKMYFLKGGDSETKESSYCEPFSRDGPCDPNTCCSKACSPDLCKPYQDLITKGVYVPVKWVGDKIFGFYTFGSMFSGRIILNGFKKVLDIAIDTLKQRVPDIKNLIADFTSSNKHLTGGSSRKKKTK